MKEKIFWTYNRLQLMSLSEIIFRATRSFNQYREKKKLITAGGQSVKKI